MKEAINKLHLLVGFTLLLLGILCYYFFRISEHTYFLQFLNIAPHLTISSSHLLKNISNSLPTFIHVFAFSLLTAGLIASSKKGYAAACLLWFGFNVLFEIGQKFDRWVIQIIPDWFSSIAFLENTESYFLKGRFDYLDLLSIALGSLAAYTLLIKTMEKKEMVGEK